MDNLEGQDFQVLRSSDFPATVFFIHIFNGTKYFHSRDFEKAIAEWEDAAQLQPDLVDMKRMPNSVSFRSNLADVPLVGLLYAVSSNSQSGVVIVRSDYAYKEIFFKEGWIVSARTTKSEERIGNFLLKRDLAQSSDLEELAAQAKKSNMKFGRFLVMKGLLTKNELHELLEFQIQEILSDLLSWREGEFFFTESEVEDDEVIVSYTPLHVALLAAKRSLEFSAFRNLIPNNKVIFCIPPYVERDRETVLKELDVNEKFIFCLIDSKRNINQLIKSSGNDEVSVVNILYRLALKGWIEKSKVVETREDTDIEEITQFAMVFAEVFRLVVEGLSRELGVGAKNVLGRVMEGLPVDYRKIFHGMPMERHVLLDAGKILKNASFYFPNRSDRLIFIDGFNALISNILQEMNRILGLQLTKKVTSDIEKVKGNIAKFYTDTPIKKRVLETFDAMVDKFIM